MFQIRNLCLYFFFRFRIICPWALCACAQVVHVRGSRAYLENGQYGWSGNRAWQTVGILSVFELLLLLPTVELLKTFFERARMVV